LEKIEPKKKELFSKTSMVSNSKNILKMNHIPRTMCNSGICHVVSSKEKDM
jgi:hypothetical protein